MASIIVKKLSLLGSMIVLLAATPLTAQVRSIDPNSAVNKSNSAIASASIPDKGPIDTVSSSTDDLASAAGSSANSSDPTANTYDQNDMIGAAEGVFGKGAKGLAEIIEKILKDQGRPNAYIAGREAAGAIVVGLRYGSGTLVHHVEGRRPVYWTGPSLGFDAGGDATKTFALVYNLYDSQDLYRRYGQMEGRAYFVGGFAATYLRRGNVVVIPIRLGVGVRLGANIGYMKFTEKARWMPF